MITDRTAEDVARWRELRTKRWDDMTPAEKNDWLGVASRGAYNYTDMNRVERAVEILLGRLAEWNIYLPLVTKTDWKQSDGVTDIELNRYLGNIKRLIFASGLGYSAPPLPSRMDYLTYEGANNIEKALIEIDHWLSLRKNQLVYLGEVYGGEI